MKTNKSVKNKVLPFLEKLGFKLSEGEATGGGSGGMLSAEPGDYVKHTDDYSIIYNYDNKTLYFADAEENYEEFSIEDLTHLKTQISKLTKKYS